MLGGISSRTIMLKVVSVALYPTALGHVANECSSESPPERPTIRLRRCAAVNTNSYRDGSTAPFDQDRRHPQGGNAPPVKDSCRDRASARSVPGLSAWTKRVPE